MGETPLNLTKSGHIVVDEHFQTNITDVYAIGDVTEFPIMGIQGQEERMKLPFWQIAQAQGKTAALSIVGKHLERKLVPFIWLDIFKKHITFCGNFLNNLGIHSIGGQEIKTILKK